MDSTPYLLGMQGLREVGINLVAAGGFGAEPGGITSFEEALRDAQARGFAEADPTLDVGGGDSAHKISLLASFAFGGWVDYRELLGAIAAEATVAAWAERAESLEKRIQRLGPINLAAIEEYEEESQRKVYLDAQNTDLMEALQTLEQAIAKIAFDEFAISHRITVSVAEVVQGDDIVTGQCQLLHHV